MISESQERMVAVVRDDFLPQAQEVVERWELHFAVVGEVTDTAELRAYWHGDVVGSIPARFLTDECPRYEVEREPRTGEPPAWSTPAPDDPNVASKEWVYAQYDQLVGSRTVRRPGLDAAVLRLRPSLRGLAVSLQGPRLGERDPYRAGTQAVLGAALNVACAGGDPLALTDCLNFGNPEKAEIGWELARAVDAIAEAAEALGVPVVSGNVSLYNETEGRAIPPTPVVGCVGLVPDVRYVPLGWREGDAIVTATVEGLAAEAALIRFIARVAPLLSLAHDVGDGGIEAALVEAARWSAVGAEVDLPFGARVVLACPPDRVGRLGAQFTQIGVAGGTTILGEAVA
jgi:phosphoribosylformylglycinamidine synthase